MSSQGQPSDPFLPPRKFRNWLLLQAELQHNFAQPKRAIPLLELLEATFGEEKISGLMLCRAWKATGEIGALEERGKRLLTHSLLTPAERSGVYHLLSAARWRAGDRKGARQAQRLYLQTLPAAALDTSPEGY